MGLYNIAPHGKSRLFTEEQIREAALDGTVLWLNLGRLNEPAKCRLAATVSGWCTVVLENGAIVQEWAGSFEERLGNN